MYVDGTIALSTDNEVVFSSKDNSSLEGIHRTGRDPKTLSTHIRGISKLFSVKSQITNILGFVSCAVSVATTPIRHVNAKVATDNT